MEDFQHLCPVCKTNGKDVYLQLRQIDLSTAVYLCKDLQCSYPAENEWMFIEKNLYQDDDNDSDISDSVNEDIENMKLKMKTCDTKEVNVSNCINNNYSIDNSKNNNVPKTDNNLIKDLVVQKDKKINEFVELKTSPISVDKVNTENTNVVIEDPQNLFSTLTVPKVTDSSVVQVLAVGMPDLDAVNININNSVVNNLDKTPLKKDEAKPIRRSIRKSRNIATEINPVILNKPEINISDTSNVKCQKIGVSIKSSIGMTEKNQINKFNSKKDPQAVYYIMNPNTGIKKKITQEDASKHLMNKKIIKTDPSKIKNIVDKINTNTFQLISPKKEIISDTKQSKQNNYFRLNDFNVKKINADLDLDVEQDSTYEKPDFESIYKSKLKLQSKKDKPSSFSFNESIVQEALETMNMSQKSTRKPKPTLVKLIMEKKSSKKGEKHSASSFQGFQFSSSMSKYNETEKKPVSPPQKLVTKINLKHKSPEVNPLNKKITKVSENINGNSLDKNSSCSSTNNLNADDISFIDLLDNINNLEPMAVPNNTDIDEWLNLL